MLKWTVTKRSDASGRNILPQAKALLQQRHHARRSLGALSERIASAPSDGTANGALRMKKARRSLGASIHNDCANYDKENQCITSTPHPASGRTVGSPYTMALRDVSNITPNTTPCRPSNATPQSRKRTLAASPVSTGRTLATRGKENVESIRETYATTLPTFDIEYSPCGVKNVPYLALRGLGLADFDKPGRYFATDEEEPIPKRVKTSKTKSLANEDVPMNVEKINPCLTPLSSRLSDLCFNKINFKRPLSVGKTINLLPPPPPPPSSSSTETIEDNELSLNSSEMGDLTLDKMIDAILESAKKDSRWATPRPKRSSSVKSKQSKGSSPTYTPADDPAADLYLGHQFPSGLLRQERETTIILEETSHINEREVKTPDVKRDQFHKATASITKGGYVRQSLSKLMMASPLEAACHLRRQKAVRRKHKLEAAGNALRAELQRPDMLREDSRPASPETPYVLCNESKMSEMNVMQTPIRDETEAQELENPPQQVLSANATPNIRSIDLQGTSTPTGESIGKTRKCLTFSPTLSEDSIEKRRSVASSTNSRMSTMVTSSSSGAAVRGTLELSIGLEQDRRLQVHVVRCKDLQRTASAGSTAGCNAINAYVKLALINLADSQAKQKDSGFQRTTVHRNSHCPYYDQRFHFEVFPDDERRIQLAVWHRDRECKRSEFLGCMSFPVKNVTKQGINGTYRLQPQSCLTNPTTPILETMGENSQSSMEELMNADDNNSARATATVTSATASLAAGSVAAADGTVDAGGEQISLSKKAIHQRDADENLFLRFLELDPSPDAPSATSGGVSQLTPATPRRSSVCASGTLKPTTGTSSSGRTPFTITKRLARTGDRGFGFSIVWTHPPRVEKVETGLSADRAGILPGDYVVFVDKHNVVTMPEQDVLNLIRTQGNTLLLEIFRRPLSADGPQLQTRTNGLRTISSGQPAVPSHGSMGSSTAHIAPFNASNGIALPLTDEGEPLIRTSPSPFGVARSSTACSNISIETAKRKLHLPQVTFSKEVGKGVLV